MRKTLRCLTLCLLIAAVGCEAESSMPPATLVRDSAGVRVVEYPAATMQQAGFRLQEVLRVGVVEGAEELMFGSIAGGLILPDGGLALADLATSQVRIFSSDGSFVRSHGRQGEGPGEYEYIRGMARCRPLGFTVFDLDYTMNHYDDTGAFIETSAVRLEGAISPYHLSCDRDGRMAAVNWSFTGNPMIGFYTATARLRILDAEGNELLDLGERIGSERFGTPNGSGPHPIGRSTVFAFQRGELIVADGSFFGYERWSPTGMLTEIVRIDVPPPSADSLMAEYMETSLARATSEEQRRSWRQEIEAMEGPQTASHISGLFLTDGRVLLQEKNVSGQGRWFEFGSDGEPVGWWPMPAGATLLDVVDDRVLVSARDDLGVPRAVLYQLVPAE